MAKLGEALNEKSKKAVRTVRTVSAENLFRDKCPEALRIKKRLDQLKASAFLRNIWERTNGNPCKQCNRPKSCKLRICAPKKAKR